MAIRDIGPLMQQGTLSLADLMLTEANRRRQNRLAILHSFIENLRQERAAKKQREAAKTEQQQRMAMTAGAILASAFLPSVGNLFKSKGIGGFEALDEWGAMSGSPFPPGYGSAGNMMA